MAKGLSRIHLVRHGEVHNPQQVLYGRLSGFRLSDQGRRQAEAAGRHLAGQSIRSVFTSPMLRAQQTAEAIIGYHKGLKLHTEDLLNEVCTPFEGLSGSEIDARNGDMYSGTADCFEQPEDIVARARRFIGRHLHGNAGQAVIGVTHGDVIVFTVLWAMGQALTPSNKNRLKKAGFPASYPALASITTLIFNSGSGEERPRIEYVRPY